MHWCKQAQLLSHCFDSLNDKHFHLEMALICTVWFEPVDSCTRMDELVFKNKRKAKDFFFSFVIPQNPFNNLAFDSSGGLRLRNDSNQESIGLDQKDSCLSEVFFAPVRHAGNNPASSLLDLLSQDSPRNCPAKTTSSKSPWPGCISELIKGKERKGLGRPTQHTHAVLQTHLQASEPQCFTICSVRKVSHYSACLLFWKTAP